MSGVLNVPGNWSHHGNRSTNIQSLEDFNSIDRTRRIPVIAYLAVLFVVGVFGNGLVVYINIFKFKPSNRRCFVLCLATLDLLACCLCMPFEIVENCFPYMFYLSGLCRFFKFFIPLTSSGSIFILIVIAVDRYLKICHAMKRELTISQAKLACALSVVAAIMISWPASVFYGGKSIQLTTYIVGVECGISDRYHDSKYPMVYSGFLVLLVISSIVVLGVLYTLMWRQIVHWGRLRVTFTKGPDDRSGSNVISACIEQVDLSTVDSSDMEIISKMTSTETIVLDETNTSNGQRKRFKDRKVKMTTDRTNKVKHKMLKTMFTITVVYVLSFLPFLVVMILRATTSNKNSDYSSVGMSVLVRSFFVNNISNAFIYGFWDREFRKRVRQIIDRFCFCKTA